MTQPALDIVQQAYAAFGRGDLEAMLSLMCDDVQIQFVGDRDAPYTGRVQGKSQVAEWFGAIAQADDIQAFEPRRLHAGAEHVTVIGWERTVARRTGRSFECEWVHVWTLRDGRLATLFGLLDTQAAAAARGA